MELLYNSNLGLAIFIVLGLLFGSFATMASYRIPRGENLTIKPSNCPKCHHRLGFFDLFPLFSWLLNRGKCHYCKAKISWRYPLIELSMATIFAIIYKMVGINLTGLLMLLMAVCLVIALVIRLERK